MITKIISGGQTGADRTALEVAYEHGIPTGGHCPKNCRIDTGWDPELKSKYGLEETDSSSYVPRTILNTQNSDGTVWFGSTSSPGYLCTLKGVNKNYKLMICNPTPEELIHWITLNKVRVLNVAGNRQRTNPGIIKLVRDTLTETIRLLKSSKIPSKDWREVLIGGGCE